jgi:HSP20 family molecular chaperone IbpA
MGNLQSFQHEMNRMFDEFFRGGNGEAAGTGLGSWTPAVDIHETDDGFVIRPSCPASPKTTSASTCTRTR